MLYLMLDAPPLDSPTVEQVAHPYFRTPDDGMWCILLDGVEVGGSTSIV